ncbi:MAG: hypothetical protein JSS75_13220 [Bacteroidetes bacterium]|nr:hypothetical protein [Bacteroidota bacterium]
MKSVVAVIVFLLLGVSTVWAQTFDTLARSWWHPGAVSSLPVIDSMTQFHDVRSLEFGFDHTSSLYNWSAGSQLSFHPQDPLSYHPSISFSSEARSELRQDTRTRTNEGTAYLRSDFPVVARTLGLSTTLFGNTYSLNQPQSALGTIFSSLQRVSDGYALAGADYAALDELNVSASAGLAYKSFLYGKSTGSIIQARAETEPISVADGSLLDLSARLDERRFPSLGEAGRNDGARIHYVTSLGDGGSNESSIGFTLKRQDFYFNVDSLAPYARQERSEMTVDIRNSLHYPIVPRRLDFLFDGTVTPRTIDRQTKGIDLSTTPTNFLTSSSFLLPSSTTAFDLDLSSRLQWSPAAWTNGRAPTFGASVRYVENSQTNDVTASAFPFASNTLLKRLSDIFEATSYDGRQSTAGIDIGIPVAARDSIVALVSSRLLRYDTPSPDNHDDRDELYLNALLLYTHVFNDRFSASAQLRLARSHLVYLKSDRSAQNYTGKTISFTGSTLFENRSLRNVLSAEVFSNYAVYDFTLPTIDPIAGRDYLIRGVNGSDSVRIRTGRMPLFPRAFGAVSSNVTVGLYERGAYNVDAFSERPLLRTSEISGEVTFDIDDRSAHSPTLVRLGARAFYQLRSAPNTAISTSLSLQERIARFGPLVVVVLDDVDALGLRLYGSLWYSTLVHDEYDAHRSSSAPLVEGRLAARWTF